MADFEKLSESHNVRQKVDILIIGAGLSGLSLAYSYLKRQPQLSILILEADKEWRGDRTWSFHENDIENHQFWKEFIDFEWIGYDVYFSHQRTMNTRYFSIHSSSFFRKMQSHLKDFIELGVTIANINSNSAIATDGKLYQADFIFDTRPRWNIPLDHLEQKKWGFQKFVGLEVELNEDHGLQRPVLMDARVEQMDGYRFFYLLPYSAQKLLVEETFYSEGASLAPEERVPFIKDYIAKRGWTIKRIIRREEGVLPIPTSSDRIFETHRRHFQIGAGAGFYHPVTGYSLSWAFKVADHLSLTKKTTQIDLNSTMKALHSLHKKTERFYIVLNRLLFWGSTTQNRRNIFERFYRLPGPTIDRFYAGKSSLGDRLRLLIGRPPIPIKDGVRALLTKAPPCPSSKVTALNSGGIVP